MGNLIQKYMIVLLLSMSYQIGWTHEIVLSQPTVMMDKAKKLYNDGHEIEALEYFKILGTSYFPWYKDSFERIWFELAIYHNHCDLENFTALKNYFTTLKNNFLKTLDSTDFNESPLFIHNLLEIDSFKVLFDNYNQQLESSKKLRHNETQISSNTDNKKTETDFDAVGYYRTMIHSDIIENNEELIRYLWFWISRIDEMTLSQDQVNETVLTYKKEDSVIAWPLKNEVLFEELPFLKATIVNKCKSPHKSLMVPNISLALLQKKYLNETDIKNIKPEIENKKSEEIYSQIKDSEVIKETNFRDLAHYWQKLYYLPFADNDSKLNILSLWEARLKILAVQMNALSLQNASIKKDAILLYKIYLAYISPSRFEMAFERHLGKLYEENHEYFLAAIHFESSYLFKRDETTLQKSLENFLKAFDEKPDVLQKLRIEKALRRLTSQKIFIPADKKIEDKIRIILNQSDTDHPSETKTSDSK